MAKAKVNLKAKLAKLAGAYKSATPGGASCTLEDGNYKAQLTGLDLLDTAAGDLMLKSTYTICEGEDNAGEEASTNDQLKTEQNFGFLKSKIKKFGYDPDDLNLAEDLEGLLVAIVASNPICKIQVKNNGDFVNIYVNKVLEMDEAPEAADGQADGEAVEELSEASEELTEELAEETREIVKGDNVEYTPPRAKKPVICKVLVVDPKKGLAKLDGTHGVVKLDLLTLVTEAEAADELVEEIAEDEGVEELVSLEVGAKVETLVQGKKVTGLVTSVDNDAETAKVKIDKTGKVFKVPFGMLEVL